MCENSAFIRRVSGLVTSEQRSVTNLTLFFLSSKAMTSDLNMNEVVAYLECLYNQVCILDYARRVHNSWIVGDGFHA